MKFLAFLLVCLLLVSCVGSVRSYRLSAEIHQNVNLPFIQHHGTGKYQNYLAMNIVYQPMAELFAQVNQDNQGVLQNRGEAHITVITPPEFDRVLSQKLTIEQIDAIAQKRQIQASRFEVVCLGRGTAEKDGELMQTYFVVVESADLLRIRKEVEQLFIAQGGEPGVFKAERFYPHITLGFNPRDLHESDGVVKDKSRCYASIK